MTKITEANLAELKDLILTSQRTIENRLISLEEKVENVDKRLIRLEEKVEGVSIRLGILENRTTLQVNWFLVIITALVGGLLTVIGKFTFPPNP